MKSPVQIFRRRVLGPGITEHNGRGVYDMETNLTFVDVMERVEKLQDRTDLIMSVARTENGAEVIFRKLHCGLAADYRVFRIWDNADYEAYISCYMA